MENDTMRITIDKWNKGMKRTFEYFKVKPKPRNIEQILKLMQNYISMRIEERWRS